MLQFLQVLQPTNEVLSKVQHAVCVLNAFGNAMAQESDDSSRCGKLLELQLDENQQVIGCGISTFGLEVSRVTQVNPEQRNFHVFHYLTEGKNNVEESLLGPLTDAWGYRYLTQNGDAMKIPGVDDAAKYTELKKALIALNFSVTHRSRILRSLALILHIGNLQFSQPYGETVHIADKSVLDAVAGLMRCDSQALLTLTPKPNP